MNRAASRQRNLYTLSGLLWMSLFIPRGFSRDPSAEQVVTQLQSKYEQITSFSAHFTQIFRGHNLEQTESGILIMMKPGRMYWEYQEPKRKYFVSDGKKAYFYVPADRQVMESDLRLDAAETPLLFLLGKGHISRDFEVNFESEESPLKKENLLIRLTPRQPRGEFSRVLVEIDPSTYLIHRLSVIEPVGNRNDYIFTNIMQNIRVPSKKFKFKIPAGVEVIRQE